MKVVLSPQGAADLMEIAERLGPSLVGMRFVDRFESALERLERFPESGTPQEGLGPDRRRVILDEFYILYELRPDHVWISSIVHGPSWLLSLKNEDRRP